LADFEVMMRDILVLLLWKHSVCFAIVRRVRMGVDETLVAAGFK
jgi:hypothetical protein